MPIDDTSSCRECIGSVDDYIDGTLVEPARRRLETHLAGCRDCRALVERGRRIIALARRSMSIDPAPAPDPDLDPDLDPESDRDPDAVADDEVDGAQPSDNAPSGEDAAGAASANGVEGSVGSAVVPSVDEETADMIARVLSALGEGASDRRR